MKHHSIFLSAFLLFTMEAQAQQLTLEQCKAWAAENYPAVRQYAMLQSMQDYSLANIARGWYPQISVSAGGYAFTDVIEQNQALKQVGVDMKNLAASASVTVKQPIYDGGAISASRQVVENQTEVNRQQTSVTLYAVNERVEQIYFGILLLDEQIAQTGVLLDDLAASRKSMESLERGGLASTSDIDAVRVEQVKAQQQRDALSASRTSYCTMLATLTGKTINTNAALQKPSATLPSADALNQRPELSLFAAQSSLLDAKRRQLDANLRPTLGFAGMALGHTEVSSLVKKGWLAAGVTLSWNISALYTRKSDLKQLAVQNEMIQNQRDIFLFNTRLQHEQTDGAVASLRRQIEQDEEIVSLRESIYQQSQRRVTSGTESADELLRKLNAVSQARLQKSVHEVQLLKEIYQLKTLYNN